jgi:hypothetical protein
MSELETLTLALALSLCFFHYAVSAGQLGPLHLVLMAANAGVPSNFLLRPSITSSGGVSVSLTHLGHPLPRCWSAR